MINNKKLSLKKGIKLFLIIAICVLLYSWYVNCLKNHSKTFNEIGKPIVQNVLAFYKENQRYPSLEESVPLLEKSGCTNIKRTFYKEYENEKKEIYQHAAHYDCDYKSVTYNLGLNVGDLTINKDVEPYGIGFHEGNTRCSAPFFDDGTSSYKELLCFQDSCLLRNLSH